MSPAPSFNLYDSVFWGVFNMETVKNKKIFENLMEEGAG